MMQVFRNAAKPVIYVLTISFFVWLVWDLSGLGTGNGGIFRSQSVGKVNGQSIDIRAFDQRVQNLTTEQQQRGASLGLDQIQEIRDKVWDEAIREVLLSNEYRRLGLSATTDEVAEAIRNIPLPEIQQVPTFQTNGKFDLAKYQRWLASAEGQQYVPGLEAQYRAQLLQAKLFRSVVSDVFFSDATLWERYRDEREQVKVGLVRIDPVSNVNDQAATVSAQEAEQYYNQHKDEFKRAAGAFLSFVSVPRAANASDTAAARARATSIREELVKGAPFAEVARRESADSISAAKGGDLGEMTKSGVDPKFGAAAMSIPLKSISEPVLSSFGFHLIQVDSRTADKFTGRHILIPIEVTGTHRDQLDAMADSLQSLAAEKQDGAALDTAARALKLTIRHAGPVAKGARVFVPEFGQVPDAGVWAFQAKVGYHSQVIDSPSAYFVFRLDSLQPEGIPPFAAIKADVELKVKGGKKAQEALHLAETLAKQVAAGTSLSQGAKTMGFEYREVGPFARLSAPLGSPALIGTAFSLKKGEVSRPVTAGKETTDPGIYLFEALDRTLADSADFAKNVATIRQQALQAAKRSRLQAYMAALKDNAKIVDHRSDVYKTAAQTAAGQTSP